MVKLNDILQQAKAQTEKDGKIYFVVKNKGKAYFTNLAEVKKKALVPYANTSRQWKNQHGITIVIAMHNNFEETRDTVENIFRTSNKYKFDIIVVDDGSAGNYKFRKEVKYIKHPERIGVGAALTTGADAAKTPYLLLCGSDVRFRSDAWLSRMIGYLSKPEQEKSLVSTCCLTMSPNKLDIQFRYKITTKDEVVYRTTEVSDARARLNVLGKKHNLIREGEEYLIVREDMHGKYRNIKQAKRALNELQASKEYETTAKISNYFAESYGATIMMYLDHSNRKKRPTDWRNCIEARWWKQKDQEIYQIPCILGACYGVRTEWFKYIKGWEGHKNWGTLEPYISMKSWLMGGDCKIAKNIHVGHIFKGSHSDNRRNDMLIYNKLMTAYLLFPDELADNISDFMATQPLYEQGQKMFIEALPELSKLKEYLKPKFTRDIYQWFLDMGIELKPWFKKVDLSFTSHKVGFDYSELYVKDLKELCNKQGIKYTSKWKKQDFIDALKK
jgi:glycosyltransferase involved in cell wall biosynthesis